MLDALAVGAMLSSSTMTPSLRRDGRIKIVSNTTFSSASETPLPGHIVPAALLLQEYTIAPTPGGVAAHMHAIPNTLFQSRSILDELEAVAAHLQAAGVLEVDEAAESLVSRMVADNMPSPSKRILARRRIK